MLIFPIFVSFPYKLPSILRGFSNSTRMKGLNLRLCLQNMTLQNSGYAEYLYATHARGAAVGGDDLKKVLYHLELFTYRLEKTARKNLFSFSTYNVPTEGHRNVRKQTDKQTSLFY